VPQPDSPVAALHIALIRGIGGPSHKLVTMKQLEQAVAASGIGLARSVLATGNLVIRSDAPADEVRACIDGAMRRFGLVRPVVMRAASELEQIVARWGSQACVLARPSQVLVTFFDAPVAAEFGAAVRERVAAEVLTVSGRELLIDFAGRISESKLELGFLERHAGSTGTARNWNTLERILAAAEGMI
jgi:uncharacterized protein (DUF1697 family)